MKGEVAGDGELIGDNQCGILFVLKYIFSTFTKGVIFFFIFKKVYFPKKYFFKKLINRI